MKAQQGDHVSIHFVGSVKDTGKEFDATHHIEPFNFILGDNAIMPGLDQVHSPSNRHMIFHNGFAPICNKFAVYESARLHINYFAV